MGYKEIFGGSFLKDAEHNEGIIEDDLMHLPRSRMDPYDFVIKNQAFINDIRALVSARYPNEIQSITDDVRKEIEIDLNNAVKQRLMASQLMPEDDKVPIFIHHIFAEILGLGAVIEGLLDDDTVDEIIIQNYDTVLVERYGKIEDTPYRFASFEDLRGKIQKIIRPLNMEFDALHPNIDAQLPDGSRISASIPPFRTAGQISLDIRKFAPHVHPLSWYINHYKSQAPEMAEFEEMCTRRALNILVSGGTGSGKTTFLNSLSIEIPNDVRIITIEDTLELKLQQARVESYQKVSPNMEGKGGISMQEAVIAALRKRPDRIIIGEVRGAEIVEMINAMNTGHDGSLSTIHANNPNDCITRASLMILSNPDTSHLKETAIRQMLASAIHLIIQASRMDDGSRKIVAVTEIVGLGEPGYRALKEQGFIHENEVLDPERLYIQDVFRFEQTGMESYFEGEVKKNIVHGRFIATGWIPKCLEQLRAGGEVIDEKFFEKRVLLEV